MNLVVWVADIGSIRGSNFGWCRATGLENFTSGSDIWELARGVAQDLNSRNPVALGFECPLFVPIKEDPIELTSARQGEGNRPWSAGAGAAALAAGLTQSVWVLEKLRELLHVKVKPTFDWKKLMHGEANLFIWEAFVTAEATGGTHEEDAKTAARTFWARYPGLEEASDVTAENPYSLVGAALLRAGLLYDVWVLRQPCMVLKSTRGQGAPRGPSMT